MKRYSILLFLFVALVTYGQKKEDLPYKNPSVSVEERVKDLLKRMTPDEKIAQMLSFWNDHQHIDSLGKLKISNEAELLKNGIGEISGGSRGRNARDNALFMNAFQKYLIENTRLGIPAISHEEALHGHWAEGATSFPQALALGSTWNPKLIEEIFTAVSKEVRLRGNHQVLSPVLDVARDARFGRTEEMYGEDTYLVSCMGVACIRGFQGRSLNIDNQHVIATGKHFAAHGQPEGGYNGAPATCSERTLREVFLPPFKKAVQEANLYSIMPAYFEIDGIPCHANRFLLKNILRDEWGFKGYIVSDYNGISQLISSHKITGKEEVAATMALNAGVDIDLPGQGCYRTLKDLVKQGKISESMIDTSVSRILRAKFMLGLFENPYVDPDLADKVTNNETHRKLALKAAQEAIILLKNEKNLLPLNKDKIKNIAVIGPNAAECHPGGYGQNPSNAVSILEGIKRKVGKSAQVYYALGCNIVNSKNAKEDWNNIPVVGGTISNSGGIQPTNWAEDSVNISQAVNVAKKSDVVVVVVGENEFTCREGWSGHLGDRDNLDLLGSQDKLIEALYKTRVPVVVVLIHGRPNSINYIAGKIPAILEGWYLGQETGTAVADVLFGDINPGGKLTISIPRSVGQLPVYYSKKPSAVSNNYYFSSNTPLWPFGYGLSYTSFEYSNLKLSAPSMGKKDTIRIFFDIKNTGLRTGDEIAQLYIRDIESSVTRPIKELKDFERVTLKPGETKTVTFTITSEKLSFYDIAMHRTVEPGSFDIMIGSSSDNILLKSNIKYIEN
jgi:beta-glucosidase